MTDKATEEFDWIKLHNDVRAGIQEQETTKQRMFRKMKENPFVPIGQFILRLFKCQIGHYNIYLYFIGCLATFCALSYGLWSFRTGNRKMSQYMMRTRIVAQGFTVLALIIGIGMSASGTLKKEK